VKFTEEQLANVLRNDGLYDTQGNEIDYEIAFEDDWVDQGKYQTKEVVFKVDDRFYRFYVTRSGSYWSDYDHWYDNAVEVKPVKKVIEITAWEAV
jgi:hypothetical protein